MHVATSRLLFEEEVGRWPSDLAARRGWVIHTVAYPTIDCEFTKPGRTPLRVQVDASDWDDQPPSIKLLNSSGHPLPTIQPNSTSVFHPGPHPRVGGPFVCMAGSREFHTHDSHLAERWDQFRGKPDFGLSDILTKVWHAWLKGTD